jgi:hypothetical protein
MPSRVQTLRSSVKGQRPAPNSREVGELYVNYPDRQIGMIDTSKAAVDLVAVRYFAAATDYAAGDFVCQAGQIYRAKAVVTAGAFNASQWDVVATQANILGLILNLDGAASGLDSDLLDGQQGTFYLDRTNHTGTQAIATVAGLQASLDTKSPLASPTFTGDPKAPTPTAGDSDTSVATTAFVQGAVGAATTPAGILASLLTVDGAGTGLDADLLDGQQGAYYLALANMTGSISGAQHGTQAGGTLHPLATASVAGFFMEAPADGLTYGRKNGSWATVVGGATISDTPPGGSKLPGQLWFESDTGNTFIWFDDGNTTQWVQINVGTGNQGPISVDAPSDGNPYVRTSQNWALNSGLVSVSADMSAMLKTSPNRFVINDKPDGTGTDVATISDAGAMTLGGASTITASGLISGGQINSSQAFVSTATSGILAATGAGVVYLRPNGVGSGTGQAYVDSAGHFIVANYVSGTSFEGGHLNSVGLSTSINVNGNVRCKNGISVAGGGYGGNWFNMLWNSAAMVLFVDNTNLGTINTTSDYRIKKDVAELPSTWEQVKALRPISYTQAEFTPPMSEETEAALPDNTKPATEPMFRDDNIERWGFIAHETQETLLQTTASGHKDMEDGVQGLNWAPIVAALTKALQEAMARIEALEAR